MNKNTTIKLIKSHANNLKKRGVTGMYLFGSVARNQETHRSDIDLFFDYDQDGHFSLFNVMEIQEYVEEILGEKTDVIPRGSLHRRIRKGVIEEALRIF